MRLNTIIMLGLAMVFGGLAVVAGRTWLIRQASLGQPQVAAVKEEAVPTSTIVVASAPLRYGDEVNARNVREIRWPSDAIPPGAFKTVGDVVGPEGKRIVLAAIEPNEPVLPAKITGPGQRGTLSALIEDGMGAVTIQVNEVIGVAGFVLPGDRVDVLLTRSASADGAPAAGSNSYTDVVLQNVRVLAAGQTADERASKPAVVNAVTIEVGSVAAQKVALAAKAGSLSLVLRKAGDVASRPGRRVAINEIGQAGSPAQSPTTTTVRVLRGMEGKDYSVPAAPIRPVNTDLAVVPSAAPRAERGDSASSKTPVAGVRRVELGL
jgi:pilus assembly protein CpaB